MLEETPCWEGRPARGLCLPSVGQTGKWGADESLVDKSHHISALWDLGHVTLQGAQSMVVSPSPPTRSFLPAALHPADNLPSSNRGSPTACSLTGSKGQKGTESRSSNQTAHRRAVPMTWRSWSSFLSPVLLPHGCYHRTLAGYLDLSCSFCKMGAR